MKRTSSKISEAEFIKFNLKVRKLFNKARYEEALALVRKYKAQYSDSLIFTYFEAVFEAEDDEGFTQLEINNRHKKAAKKLKPLLFQLHKIPKQFRSSVRNEYYWFSHQPRKQYRLGKKLVLQGYPSSYYSQGVGAVEIAKIYAKKGRTSLFLRWAKIAEDAWLQLFEYNDKWFNSYFFYAAALGYQGRYDEMNAAFEKASKIARKPKNWPLLKAYRKDIENVVKAAHRSRKRTETSKSPK